MLDIDNWFGYTLGDIYNECNDRKAHVKATKGKITMKITVVVEVNIYSPQMGQSLSRLRSIHLCFPLSEMAIQILHVLQ